MHVDQPLKPEAPRAGDFRPPLEVISEIQVDIEEVFRRTSRIILFVFLVGIISAFLVVLVDIPSRFAWQVTFGGGIGGLMSAWFIGSRDLRKKIIADISELYLYHKNLKSHQTCGSMDPKDTRARG